jgi:hypothetical protein
MKKLLLTILLFSISIITYAQQYVMSTDLISLRISMMQVSPNFGSLAADYIDDLHQHFHKDFSLSGFPPMFGADMTSFGIRTPKRWFFEGLGFGYYRGRHSDFFHAYTGLGYEVKFNDKLSVTPIVTIGVGEFSYFFGRYQANSGIWEVHGKSLYGNFTAELAHSSIYTTPRLAITYTLSEDIKFELSGGYRLDLRSKERLVFVENRYNNSANRAARIHASEGIWENGHPISGKIINLSGFTVGISSIMSMDW